MKADISRNTFNENNNYLRVLMQQGRAVLDADLNEQTSILLHFMRNFTQDIIGKHGGPLCNAGFRIITDPETDTELTQEQKDRLREKGILPLQEGDFLIGKGHYYVEGILCDLQDYITYSGQAVPTSADLTADGPFLVYLDAWERLITPNEDEFIRELALSGPDTANRTQLICQVKVTKTDLTDCPDYNTFRTKIANKIKPGKGTLQARVHTPEADITDTACLISPESQFRGAENQLYRVEIHGAGNGTDAATFKWSRENGSVVFPIVEISTSQDNEEGEPTAAATTTVTLQHLGRDERFGLQVNDWVEIVDENVVLECRADDLLRVLSVDPVEKQVILDGPTSIAVSGDKPLPLLRRWDSDGALKVAVPADNDGWITLEDGVEVHFDESMQYQTGDNWLIPARAETGNIIWPTHTEENEGDPIIVPDALAPHGQIHYYAPLAIINKDDAQLFATDCRCEFLDLCQLTTTLVNREIIDKENVRMEFCAQVATVGEGLPGSVTTSAAQKSSETKTRKQKTTETRRATKSGK